MYYINLESSESLNDPAVKLRNSGRLIGNAVPPKVAKDMILSVPDDWFQPTKAELDGNYILNLDEYTNNHRVLDICCNSGVLLYQFLKKFFSVLQDYKNFSDNLNSCYEYILKNLLFGVCCSRSICKELRGILYNNEEVYGNIYHYDIGAYLEGKVQKSEDACEFEIHDDTVFIYNSSEKRLVPMKFDVVCGNPPYNDNVYADFVTLGHNIAKSYSLWITPINSFYNDSELYNTFRGSVVSCTYYPEVTDVFFIRLVEGVAYYLLSKNKAEGSPVRFTNISKDCRVLNSVLDRVIPDSRGSFCFLNCAQSVMDKIGKSGTFNYFDSIIRLNQDGDLKDDTGTVISTGGSSENKKLFNKEGSLIVLSNATGKSRFSLYASDDKDRFDSATSYTNTKFVRFLVFAHREQSINNSRAWSYVPDPGDFDCIYEGRPLVGYTTDENGCYTDNTGIKHCSLYKKYGLTDDEINVIESIVVGRKSK